MSKPEKRIHDVSAGDLRVISHPLRTRILDALRNAGPATASGLAARLGESSGATSYHLRQLAEKGFVEEDPERGKGRERWWRSVYDGLRVSAIEDFLDHPDAEVRGATKAYLQEIASRHTIELATWLGTMHEWSGAWRTAGDISSFRLRLTAERAEELDRKIHALLDDFAEDDETDETALVRFHLHAFPISTEDPK
ncbi:MAG: helix-turn-helix domain-containing protein [Kitasatospora sp.]|nr:helix-turn-helix domain-containing protein [Kitasatospora sp.]